jgi:hypothetical protein
VRQYFLKGSMLFNVLCLLVLAFSLNGIAQVTTADLLGTVTDPSGAFVPSAKVTVRNLATNATYNTTTDSAGDYLVRHLPSGHYAVRVEQSSFKAWETADLELAAGDRRRLDAQLVLGQVAEVVKVVAHSVSLQTDSSTITQLVNSTAVQDLPLNGRNFINMATVVAGANEGPPNGESTGSRPDDRRQSSQVSVNGQRTQINNEMIDGMDNNEKIIGAIGVRPSIDGIAEFIVQTNAYTAEVGRTGGAVINIITKSGTNEFHGSAFEFLRNDRLDANDFFANAAGRHIAEFRQNQFGASLGGPIKKDKTFFFADYEGLRSVQGLPLTTTVPTAAMRNGIFTGVAHIYDPTVLPRTEFADDVIPPDMLSPIAQRLLATLPPPTTTGLANNYFSQPKRTYFAHTVDVRIDHRFSDRDQVFGRYTQNYVTTFTPGNFPEVNGLMNVGTRNLSSGPAVSPMEGVQLHYLHTFGPALMLELKAGYLRFDCNQKPLIGASPTAASFDIPGAEGTVTFPQIIIDPYATIGDSSYVPLRRVANGYQYAGALSFIRGPHSLKFGGSFNPRYETVFQYFSGESLTFNSLLTNNFDTDRSAGNAVASLLLGYPSSGSISHSVNLYQRFLESSYYAQDDWRATRWLTLNLGLRYDILPFPTEKDNKEYNLDLNTFQLIYANKDGVNGSAGVMNNYRDFGPRVGFAANIGHNAVIRGGYGISYFTDWVGQGILYPGQLWKMEATPISDGASGLLPTMLLSDGFPALHGYSANPPQGTSRVYNRHFPDGTLQGFNLTAEKAIGDYVFSVGYVGSVQRHLYGFLPINNAPPGPGAIQPRRRYYAEIPLVTSIMNAEGNGLGNYNAMQIILQRRYSKGLTFNTNFTWAHAINDSTDGNNGGAQGVSASWGQTLDFHHWDRGSSDTDVRYRWAIMANYDLPFGKQLKGFSKGLISDWQLNALGAWQTGLPFSVANATSLSNSGFGNDRPDCHYPLTLSNPTLGEWFNTDAFTPQAAYTFGNCGRNILRGPRFGHIDLSLSKTFNFSDRWHLQFRAEGYNITNTPSFAQPNSSRGAPGFGTITSVLPQTTPRQIQFALKLLF